MDHEKNNKDLDDFWDIEKLIPKKMKEQISEMIRIADSFAHTYDTEPVEVILKAKESTSYDKLTTIEMRPADSGEIKLTFSHHPEKTSVPDDEYSPDNPFIKNVKVFRRDDFLYYSAFYEDGKRYLQINGAECPEPPFFSYVPQYSQLDPDQLSFYFYMRSALRRCEAVKASYSYILLYIFELLNVESDASHALSQLSFVWHSYREKYPKLDPLLKEWITDYCFIKHLLPSREALGSAFRVACDSASVKELFVCAGKSEDEMISSEELADTLLELCTNYDWRKSKFAAGENLPLYKKHIIGSLRAVLSSLKGKKGIFVGSGELKRNAFSGALCTPQNKCRIEVSYCSIARSHEMRFLITDVIKHTENRIRAYIGVKSRLTVYSLPVEVRKCIDEYMDHNLGGRRAPKKQEEPKEYDKLYDVPHHEFSLKNAKMIEESSWNTTKKLVEAFEEEVEQETAIEEVPQNLFCTADNTLTEEERLLAALMPYMDFITAENAEEQDEFARKKGRMTDSVADEINEIAAEIFGDIILTSEDGRYTVIEDYREVFDSAGNE